MIREFEALGVNNEIYVLVYFNVNLLSRDKYVFNKTNEAKKIDKDLLPEIKSTRNFFKSMAWANDRLSNQNNLQSNTSILIKNILTNTQENFSQSGVINIAISDHSLIHCTRKIPKAKYNSHKDITFSFLKNYSADVYKEA